MGRKKSNQEQEKLLDPDCPRGSETILSWKAEDPVPCLLWPSGWACSWLPNPESLTSKKLLDPSLHAPSQICSAAWDPSQILKALTPSFAVLVRPWIWRPIRVSASFSVKCSNVTLLGRVVTKVEYGRSQIPKHWLLLLFLLAAA